MTLLIHWVKLRILGMYWFRELPFLPWTHLPFLG